MKFKTKIAALSTLLMFHNFGVVNAASIDNEIAVMAAEQDKTNESVETFDPDSIGDSKNKIKTPKEIKDDEKRLEEERKAAKRKIKEERRKSRDELQGKTPLSKNPTPPIRIAENDNSVTNQNVTQVKEIPVTVENESVVENASTENKTATSDENSDDEENSPAITKTTTNKITNYASFNEMVQAMNFTPLYIPKKSGYTIISMNTIENRIAEIHYVRQWEQNTSLQVRTYHRPEDEELRDISGIHGVKWRTGISNGIKTYISKIADNKHVAAWAVGNYTFSAYAENISFAAFNSLITDELVDLTQHYYLLQ